MSEQTGTSLKKIIEGVEITGAKISEIAAAAVQQAANAQEVSKAIAGIAEVTETAAAGSQQMASSSQELGGRSQCTAGPSQPLQDRERSRDDRQLTPSAGKKNGRG